LKGIIDRMRAAIIDEVVHRVAVVDTTVMAALLPLAEGVGVEEEDARRREIFEVLQYLDDRMPQTGQVELLPAKMQDQVATATTVRLPVR
jgi:hypothetical protein